MGSRRLLRLLAAVCAALVLMSGLAAGRLLLQSSDEDADFADALRRRREAAAASLLATAPSTTGTRRMLESVTRLSASDYAAKLLDPDSFELISATYYGAPAMSGFVLLPSQHALAADFPDGAVVLTSGDPAYALRTASFSSASTGAPIPYIPGDPDVSAASGHVTYDASVLVIKVRAKGFGKVSFRYVFASEEYTEWVGTSFIDAFVLLVNGVNTAIVPGTTGTPVSINTISHLSHSALFRQGGRTEYDGYTVVLTTKEVEVSAGDELTIKMAVADASDTALDSAVFLQSSSVSLYNSCDLRCETPGGVGPCKDDSTCHFDANYAQFCSQVTNKADGTGCKVPVTLLDGACASGICMPFDTTPPVLTPSAAAMTLEGNTLGGYAAVDFNCTANDIVDGAISAVTYSPKQPGEFFPMGTTVVTCSAVDAAGNTGTATVTVSVLDTTPPVLTPSAAAMTLEGNTLGGYAAVDFNCTANDIVDGPISDVTYSPKQPGEFFPIGTTVVTCSAVDAAGNTGTATIDVSIVDTTPPALTAPTSTLVFEAPDPTGADVSFTATAYDTVDGDVAVTCDPPSGAHLSIGTSAVMCDATDAKGNAASATFSIRVERCAWTGFLPPIKNKDYNVLTTTTAVIPIKWLMGGMDFGTSGLLAPGYPRLVPITCGTNPAPNFADEGSYLEATANDLKYDSPQYHMNFRSAGLVEPGGCYRVDVMLAVCDAGEAGIRSFLIRVK